MKSLCFTSFTNKNYSLNSHRIFNQELVIFHRIVRLEKRKENPELNKSKENDQGIGRFVFNDTYNYCSCTFIPFQKNLNLFRDTVIALIYRYSKILRLHHNWNKLRIITPAEKS